MKYDEYLSKIIDTGIEGAKRDYAGVSVSKTYKRTGAIAGFEVCRLKTPGELNELIHQSSKKVREAYSTQADDYWYWRCYESEIEWVAGCVAAWQLITQNKTSGTVTTRHMAQARSALGGEQYDG